MDGLAVPAHGFKLLSGTGNRPLAEEIGRQLGIPLTKVTCNRFADGEIFVRIDENVRGNDVFIVQSTNAPAENIMELLLLIDASRRRPSRPGDRKSTRLNSSHSVTSRMPSSA